MLYCTLAVLLTAIDQITKFLTLKYLKPVGSVALLDNILSFTYVENRGAAFGMMQNARWIFITVTIAVCAACIVYIVKKRPDSKLLCTSLSLIISGAVGNLIDRILRGFVVDMIEVTFINYPVFNFADCCVVIGAVLFAIYVLFVYREPEKGDNKND